MGCRIIDSKRERLIAIITNNFIPCNGRFPLLIAMITMFFAQSGFFGSFSSSILLALIIIAGILASFAASFLLSKTLLRGQTSSFTLELPPYRRPLIGQVLIRSLLDRTLFVLGRAVAVAASAGLIIWILANVSVGGETVLHTLSSFLDPFASFIGLDGVILVAFILGFPANEIVLPIALMIYLANGTLGEIEDITEIHSILLSNGWTVKTAVCTMLFSVMHWPCSTTLMTIKKETASFKWTLVAFAVPTAFGIAVCAAASAIMGLFGL